MDDQRSLLQPLIPTTVACIATTHSSGFAITAAVATAASPSSCHRDSVSINGDDFFCTNKSVILRLLLVFSAMVISLWANYEASKTFEITLINDTRDSPVGRRFDLFYVSNDRASRLILNATSFVEQFLYPDPKEYPKKHVCHVTLRLTRRSFASGDVAVAVDGEKVNGYVVDLSPSLIEEANHGEEAISSAVTRAVARVWLWDGEDKAPARLIDGVVEYVAEEAGFRREIVAVDGEISPENEDWWENKNPKVVARFLRYCEEKKEGFIRRLNRAMRDTWTEEMVDDALGMPAKKISGFYNASSVSWPRDNIHVI